MVASSLRSFLKALIKSEGFQIMGGSMVMFAMLWMALCF